MEKENKELTSAEVVGNSVVNFFKRVIEGEEKIFTIVFSSTVLILSVIFYLYSGVEDIKSHDEMMLKTGAGELLSDGVTCKSGILYYKVNNSIAVAINSETDKPFHCRVAENKIFLK